MIANADDGILRRVNCRDSATPGGRASTDERHRHVRRDTASRRQPTCPSARRWNPTTATSASRWNTSATTTRWNTSATTTARFTAKRPCPVWHQTARQYAEWIWRVLA